jgi:hypothetical protein
MTPPRTNAIDRDADALLTGPPILHRSSVPVEHQRGANSK